MSEAKKVVIINSRGFDDERSSVAWSVANASVASGMDVTVFLVAAGADWARKGAADAAQLNPLDPTIGEMMNNVIEGGAKILVCPPCAKIRGYTEDDLVDGAILAGAPVMLEQVAAGATSLSF
jgi:predicted peroxiredoxin